VPLASLIYAVVDPTPLAVDDMKLAEGGGGLRAIVLIDSAANGSEWRVLTGQNLQ